jgi:hypothetical protein
MPSAGRQIIADRRNVIQTNTAPGAMRVTIRAFRLDMLIAPRRDSAGKPPS